MPASVHVNDWLIDWSSIFILAGAMSPKKFGDHKFTLWLCPCSVRIIRIICLERNWRILKWIWTYGSYGTTAKNRLHDLTTDRTGRMLNCGHRGIKSRLTLNTVLNLTLYIYSTLLAGIVSSRTGLELEDSSRTEFYGLALGLEVVWPWPRTLCPRIH